MARPKRLRISQGASQCSFTTATALYPTSGSGSGSAPTSTTVSEPLQNLNPAPAPTLTSIAKNCNRYWTVDIIDDQGVTRNGHLKVNEVWSLPEGQRVVVPFNAQGQAVGEAGGLLGGFLGIIGTDVNTFPISYRDWWQIPKSYKEACFSKIKAKFCLDRNIEKHFVLKKIGKNWRNYRVYLFHKYYDVRKAREENLSKHPNFIPLDMWAAFVDYRLDPKTQEMCNKNRQNRKQLKMPHTCGSKSIARKKQEMELERGEAVSRGAVFVATHKKKDGSYVNEEAKIVSEKILEVENQRTLCTLLSENDSLGQVLGKEQPGRVRGLGFGPTPTQVFGVPTDRLGRVPLNCSNSNSVDAPQQVISRLQSELQSSNQRLESEMQSANDMRKEMRGALSFIFQNVLGNVPSEFAHLINSQAPSSSSRCQSSEG